MAFEKSVLSVVAYGLLSHLRYLYCFYHSRAARAWSFCNEMYHSVFRYEYLTFQTHIYLHKQYIFDTNIIHSEYALLFPFSIYQNQIIPLLQSSRIIQVESFGFIMWTQFYQFGCMILLFWTDFIPGFGEVIRTFIGPYACTTVVWFFNCIGTEL